MFHGCPEEIRTTNTRGEVFRRKCRRTRENSSEKRWRVSRISRSKNCCPAKLGGDKRKEIKQEEEKKPRKRAKEWKFSQGGHRTFARHASHGLVPPREIPVRNTKAQRRLHVDESPRLRAAKHYDLKHIESNQIYLSSTAHTEIATETTRGKPGLYNNNNPQHSLIYFVSITDLSGKS